MVKRPFWLEEIEKAWDELSIVWLAGVRRVGKTYLCQSLADIEYYSCELPRVQQLLEDPEKFYKKNRGKRIVLDEIHVLANFSNVLKIGADHFPDTKVVAIGSSTLAASKKFSDTLTGRKNIIHLTPMLISEGALFGNDDLDHRLLFGGLPPFFLSTELPENRYREWIVSYFARGVQEIYKIDKRFEFIKFIRLILA